MTSFAYGIYFLNEFLFSLPLFFPFPLPTRPSNH